LIMIADRLKSIRDSIPESVTLVAVSKTKPLSMIESVYAVGQRHFGENRPQELAEKAKAMPEDVRWHMIGHLQTNKVKYIIAHVHLIHSIDSLRLIEEVEKRAASIDRQVDVLLQINIAAEEQKYGFTEDEVIAFFKEGKAEQYPHLRFAGLMGMATFTEDKAQLKTEFASLRKTFDSLLEIEAVNMQDFNTISMGMSGDYSIAISEGSNMVRIGSSIFGSRN
jgi:pyridoxal phosphate enzyme (YggS family)